MLCLLVTTAFTRKVFQLHGFLLLPVHTSLYRCPFVTKSLQGRSIAMLIVSTHGVSRATNLYIMRHFVTLILCAFHLSASAGVVALGQSKPGHKALHKSLNEATPNGTSLFVGSHIPGPTVLVSTDSSKKVRSHKRPFEHRANDDKDLEWDDALRAGNRILEKYQQNLRSGSSRYDKLPGGSEEAKEVLEEKYEVKEQNKDYEPNNLLARSLANDGISTSKENWLLLHIEENNAKSDFKNSYTYDEKAKAGVIIVEDADRDADAALNWSEVAFQQYSTKVPNSDPKDLKYIYHLNIINPSTMQFIRTVIDDGDGDVVNLGPEEWHVFRPGSEAFTALLGSENGRGAGHMVNDHMRELGKKHVSEIHVLQRPKLMKIVLGSGC